MKRAAAVALAASLMTAAGLQAQPIDVAAIDKLAAQAVEQKKLPGLSVGVMYNGRVVLAKGYGAASLDPVQPVMADTLFPIGSITKQIVCAAALLLEQAGKLKMTDPVAKYFPELTRARDIRLIDLGQHVAGYRDYYPLDFIDSRMRKPSSSLAIAREYAGMPLDFEPGTRYSYSNTGFSVLGAVIEKVDGMPLGGVLERRIFSPLGMTSTRMEPRAGDGALASGYSSFALAPWAPTGRESEGWTGAAGGIWSTPADMLAWDLALMDGKLLSEDSMRTLSTPRQLANGRTTNYGCGIGAGEREGMRLLAHSGAVSGFTARNTLIPASRSAIIVMTNLENDRAQALNLTRAIIGKLAPAAASPPNVAGPSVVSDAVAMTEQYQAGAVDRSRLGAEFSAFLTAERLKAAASALAPLGRVKSAEVSSVSERGGLEHALVELKFTGATLEADMYRSPDGRIEQFMLFRK